MEAKPVRIGIVGAGKNTIERHIPGFQTMEDVEVVSVANRSRESGQRVADQFGIPKVYDHWLELVEADDTDAICIGTWPYLHCPVTLVALERDKHVMTEARMAMNAEEAHRMLDASRERPHLTTQIVPSPFTFGVDETIKALIADGYLGQVLAVDMRASDGQFVDRESSIQWRQDRELSGFNILHMGIWYEALMRWVGPATLVTALTSVTVTQRRDAGGELKIIDVPDHVDILCRMAIGAQARLRFSSFAGLGPDNEVWIHGSEGTLHLDVPSLTLRGGQRGDKGLKEIPISPEKRGKWRVEEEFINAIRGLEKVKLTSFEDGVKYMEFTEAVTRSAQTGQAVDLPL
ncbi:MAG: Gfo/Idh/MocA family oxidoreductase [Chloroflexi bacterium]|nr:Gfo/Idh/MocA family oxidoreductase [Chloroflexota bacterium]